MYFVSYFLSSAFCSCIPLLSFCLASCLSFHLSFHLSFMFIFPRLCSLSRLLYSFSCLYSCLSYASVLLSQFLCTFLPVFLLFFFPFLYLCSRLPFLSTFLICCQLSILPRLFLSVFPPVFHSCLPSSVTLFCLQSLFSCPFSCCFSVCYHLSSMFLFLICCQSCVFRFLFSIVCFLLLYSVPDFLYGFLPIFPSIFQIYLPHLSFVFVFLPVFLSILCVCLTVSVSFYLFGPFSCLSFFPFLFL